VERRSSIGENEEGEKEALRASLVLIQGNWTRVEMRKGNGKTALEEEVNLCRAGGFLFSTKGVEDLKKRFRSGDSQEEGASSEPPALEGTRNSTGKRQKAGLHRMWRGGKKRVLGRNEERW